MQALLRALESPYSPQAYAAVAELATLPDLPRPVLALCAWAWHRWAQDLSTRPGARFRLLQANRLGWRTAHDRTAAPATCAALAALLQARLPAQHAALLAAAGIFNGIFPVDVYVGNGDTGGYQLDCQQQWRNFEPYREWFAEALPLSEALRCEWVTLAQVYWSHFRWQADDPYDGTFSAPACGYLLAQAVTLAVPYPIQYYYFYQVLPTPYTAEAEATPGQELALQSGLGLTYFYYAQYCQHHGHAAARAADYYQHFLAAEPGCQPDNRFYLFMRNATTRSYPPSRQEALAEQGNLALQQGQPAAARAYFEQAVAEAPASFQAPYERLAALLRAQGEEAAALTWLARKADVCTQVPTRESSFRRAGMATLFFYDPTQSGPLALDTYPGASGWLDYAARVRVLEVNELYRELADTYFYNQGDCLTASRYYKQYLAGLARQRPSSQQRTRTLDASESQVRLALEQGDYWQARSLSEKLLRLAPDNQTARLTLARIRQRFA